MRIDLRSYDPKPEGASPERDENRRGTSWLQVRSFTANLAPARTDPRAYSQQPFVHYFAAKVLPHSLDEPQGEIHRPGLVWEHATLRFAPLSVAKSPHPPLSCYVLETLARSKCSMAGRKLSAVVPVGCAADTAQPMLASRHRAKDVTRARDHARTRQSAAHRSDRSWPICHGPWRSA